MFQNTVMVDVSISYPSITGRAVSPQCVKRFNAYYDKEALGQRQYANETMYNDAVADYTFDMQQGYPFNSYTLMQVFTVSLNAYPLLSLYYDVYRYTGGAHGMTERTGDTWDLALCKRLEMKQLFVRGYDYTKPIFAYVRAETDRRQAAGEAQYFEGLADNIVRYFDEKNFYLTPQGLVVFYPLYSIAPYYVGIQEFIVPYSMFGSNMTYPMAAMQPQAT